MGAIRAANILHFFGSISCRSCTQDNVGIEHLLQQKPTEMKASNQNRVKKNCEMWHHNVFKFICRDLDSVWLLLLGSADVEMHHESLRCSNRP